MTRPPEPWRRWKPGHKTDENAPAKRRIIASAMTDVSRRTSNVVPPGRLPAASLLIVIPLALVAAAGFAQDILRDFGVLRYRWKGF